MIVMGSDPGEITLKKSPPRLAHDMAAAEQIAIRRMKE